MIRITRVEVITNTGRDYVSWEDDNDIVTSIQDDGRTLKVFVNKVEPKSPVQEAYKRWMGEYPSTTPSVDNTDDIRWRAFQIGYNASQEPKKEQKWDVVRESVKWCEEHPDESVEEYLKPHTPEKTEQLLREAFKKVQQTEEWKETQKLIDEEDSDKNFKNSLDLIKEWGEKNKPPTLYEILMDWWINHLDMEQSDEEIVDGLVDMIDKKFIPPSSDRNGYEWEKCLKMMRDKLR
jgi:hypothetical protein